MIDAVSMLRPGLIIALVCVLLAVVLGVVAVRDSRRREAERDEEIRTLRAALQQCQSKIELVVDDKKF